MVILDDAGDYPDQPHGNNWRIVSIDRRFNSLGSKRNACAALANPESEGFLICDDDDFLFPWAMAATDRALTLGKWAQPREVFEWGDSGTLVRQETFSRHRPNYIDYHSGWSYRRSTFESIRGYPIIGEEDTPVRDYLTENVSPSINTISHDFPVPFVIYSSESPNYRISHLYQQHRVGDMAKSAWTEAGQASPDGQFNVAWDIDYLSLEIPPVARRRPW